MKLDFSKDPKELLEELIIEEMKGNRPFPEDHLNERQIRFSDLPERVQRTVQKLNLDVKEVGETSNYYYVSISQPYTPTRREFLSPLMEERSFTAFHYQGNEVTFLFNK